MTKIEKEAKAIYRKLSLYDKRLVPLEDDAILHLEYMLSCHEREDAKKYLLQGRYLQLADIVYQKCTEPIAILLEYRIPLSFYDKETGESV